MAWQAAVSISDVVEGRPAIVQLGRRQVGILLHEGRYHALLNFCPHAGAPICQGRIEKPVCSQGVGQEASRKMDEPVIRCPWHHWEFDLHTGRGVCVKQKVRTFPVEVRDGMVWVDA